MMKPQNQTWLLVTQYHVDSVGILEEDQHFHIREKRFTSFAQPTSLMDVPGYVNPDKLMSVPIGFVCR